MAILSVKAAGWLRTAVEAANVGLCGPWRKASNGGAVQKFMAWVADGVANTFSVTGLTKIVRLTRTDWQGTVALSPNPRTNYTLRSYDFGSVYWATGAATKTPGQLDPKGGNTACLLTATVTDKIYAEVFGLGAPGLCAIKVWMKAGTTTAASLRIRNYATNTTVASLDITLTSAWKEYDITGTTTEGAGLLRFTVVIKDAAGGSIYVAFAHAEAGATCGSYIPTAAAPVSVTDYALASEEVTLGETPVAGAVFTLDGDITADVEA